MLQANLAVERNWNPIRAAPDLMRCAPDNRLGAQLEGSRCAGVGQVDGHHNGHTQRNAQDHEPGLPPAAQQVTQASSHQGSAQHEDGISMEGRRGVMLVSAPRADLARTNGPGSACRLQS